jgi:hypothetical protein
MSGQTPKGTRYGGRGKGTPNKRTVASIIEASQQVGEIKKLGQKKATEVLNDLMQTSMSFAARYQKRIMDTTTAGTEPGQEDLDRFWKAMECAGTFAKALAPFQDPTFKAIAVSMAPTIPQGAAAQPGDGAKEIKGRVVKLDDPVALGRLYQQMVKRIA